MNGDDADGALALQRSQSFNHAAGRQAETWRAGGFDRDQVSVLGIGSGASRYRQLLAEHFLVDRLQPAAAMRDLTEDAQYAVLGMVDDLDDAAAMANAAVFVGFFNAEQHAVAESGGFAGCGLRGTEMRILGAGPCASSSHSSGVAMRSPSLSRAVTSASTVEGRVPG